MGKSLGEKNELWYQRQFSVPSKWKGHRILLHFGAVDWKADVWVNKVKGGTTYRRIYSFSFDITPALLNGENELIVKVWGPDWIKGPQPRGKQVSKPGGYLVYSCQWYLANSLARTRANPVDCQYQNDSILTGIS